MDPGVRRPTMNCGEGDLAGCSHAKIARQHRMAIRRIRCEFYAFVINPAPKGRSQKAESRRKNAGGLARAHFCLLPSAFCLQERQKSEGRKQKKERRRLARAHFCLLPSAFCLQERQKSESRKQKEERRRFSTGSLLPAAFCFLPSG